MFRKIHVSKKGVKMNLRIITKYHAADREIRFLTRFDFKALWLRNSHADSVGVKFSLLRY